MRSFSFLTLTFVFFVCFVLTAFSFLNSSAFSSEEIYYKNTRHDLIDWGTIDLSSWTSFEKWKKQRAILDLTPEYRKLKRESSLKTIMGRVIDCIGNCRIYKGTSFALSQYKSEIREEDEFLTEKDSYAWILLFDGSLVRASPETRLSFLDFSIGSAIFTMIRISYGELIFISRDGHLPETSDLRETDTLFLPLSFFEANDESFLDPSKKTFLVGRSGPMSAQSQYKRLHDLMQANKGIFDTKKVSNFIVLPNASFYGSGSQVHIVVTGKGESYLRGFGDALLTLRGIGDASEHVLENDKLYQIDERGEVFQTLDESEEFNAFHVTEYLVSRIPSIMVARELMLQNYAKPLFDLSQTKESFATQEGRELLTDDIFKQRTAQARGHSQGLETLSLKSSLEFKGKLAMRGKSFASYGFDERYFEYALYDYITKRERESFARDLNFHKDNAYLHSVTRSFWHYINRNVGYGKKQSANPFSYLR